MALAGLLRNPAGIVLTNPSTGANRLKEAIVRAASHGPATLPTVVAAACVCLAHAALAADGDPPAPARVEIIGTTPLPGLGTPLRDVPANVQS
jgi:hypothetical protein